VSLRLRLASFPNAGPADPHWCLTPVVSDTVSTRGAMPAGSDASRRPTRLRGYSCQLYCSVISG
jgi:hypothetical protein